MEGRIEGPNIRKASVVVTDSSGKVIQQAAQLAEVQRYFADGHDPSLPASIGWGYKIDGKRLATARFPVIVKLVVIDSDGGLVEASRTVNR